MRGRGSGWYAGSTAVTRSSSAWINGFAADGADLKVTCPGGPADEIVIEQSNAVGVEEPNGSKIEDATSLVVRSTASMTNAVDRFNGCDI